MVIDLIPSHFEAKEFIAGLENRRSFRVGEADCTEGTSGSVAVTVGVIGMGLPHAARSGRGRYWKEQGAGSGERGVGQNRKQSAESCSADLPGHCIPS